MAASSTASVAVRSVFSGLAAGSHTLSLWVRGYANETCTENAGNYVHRAVLLETA